MKSILFISHDLSRSGAPLFLYNLSLWLKSNQSISPLLLAIRGGEMEKDFAEVGKLWIWEGYQTGANLKERVISKMGRGSKKLLFRHRVLEEIRQEKPLIIYANSIVSAKLAKDVKAFLNIPTLLHVHEMEFSVKHYYPEYNNPAFYETFDQFIAITKPIEQFLTEKLAIAASKIALIPPFINQQKNNQLDIENYISSTGQFVVGFSGFGDWQKGIDLLSPLMAILRNMRKDEGFRFIWLGNVAQNIQERIAFEIGHIGFKGNIIFTGKVTQPQDYFIQFHAFVSLSREDSFPLACVEAASYGVPLFCFDKSGGMADFIGNDAGFVVPFLDLKTLAEKLIFLKENESYRKNLGHMAQQKTSLYAKEKIAPKIATVITSLLNNR